MLFNQVLPVLGNQSPVNCFEWSNGGRQKVLDLKRNIQARGSNYQSDKCLMVMRSMFGYAIDMGWMAEPNPAIGEKIRQAYDRSQFWEERKKFMIAWCDALTAEGLIT